MPSDDVHPLIKIGMAVVVVALVVAACLYRKEEAVFIRDRWWGATTTIKYDEVNYEWRCHDEEVCTGYGDDRQCRTEQECGLERVVSTHIRCSDSNLGRELPVIHPDPPCGMWPGDYVMHGTTFYAEFTLQKTEERQRRQFIGSLWDAMTPGQVVVVTKNILGIIVDAEPKEG